MKHTTLITLVLAAALSYCGALWADTTITYQGRLDSGGQPFSGTANFDFALFDRPIGGRLVGATISEEGVAVTDGLFQVALDFGAGAFADGGRWLRIRVFPAPESPAKPGHLWLEEGRTGQVAQSINCHVFCRRRS